MASRKVEESKIEVILFVHRLKLVPKDSTVVLLQHHPFDMPNFVPGTIVGIPRGITRFYFSEFLYSFSSEKKKVIFQVLESVANNYWGVFAGHLHVWHDGPSGFLNSRSLHWTESILLTFDSGNG